MNLQEIENQSRGLIRSRKPWAIIVGALFLSTLVLVLGYRTHLATEQAAMDEFNHRQLALAQGAANAIELYFEVLSGDLKALRIIPEVVRLDETVSRQALRYRYEEMQSLGVNDLALLDSDGVVRYNLFAQQIEGLDFSWRDYFKKLQSVSSDEDYIVEFIQFKGVETGRRGVLIAVPLFASAGDGSGDRKLVAIAVATLKLDTIAQRFVVPLKSSERGHAFLVDVKSNLLWSPDISRFGKNMLEMAEGFPTLQRVLEKMKGGKAGTAEISFQRFNEISGRYMAGTEEKLLAYTPVRIGDVVWSIGVWAPKQDASKLVRSAYQQQMLVLALSILVILAGTYYALAQSSRISTMLEKRVEAKTRDLREAHESFRTVMDSLDAWVHVVDFDTDEILFINKALGDAVGDVVGQTSAKVLRPDQAGYRELCEHDKLLGPNGGPAEVSISEFQDPVSEVWYDCRERAIRWVDGRIVRLVIDTDITERKQVEKQLKQMAHFDSLTALPNRLLFFDRLEHELAHAKRHTKRLALMFLDLDCFKQINDELGHDMGDMVLKETAQRLKESVRESDTVARIGGDEFAVILPDIKGPEDATGVAEKLLQGMLEPFRLVGQEHIVGASIGISLYPDDGIDSKVLLKKADLAMYQVKKHGRNDYVLYAIPLQREIDL